MPANGARTTVSSRLRSASASRASATSTARAATVEPRPRRVVARLGRVERLRADDGARELLLVALERRLRIRERDLGRGEIRSALLELGTRLRDAGSRVRVVEARDDLVALDALAFLDGDGDDLARDLRGDRRLAARDDIAGRVEDRARPRRPRRRPARRRPLESARPAEIRRRAPRRRRERRRRSKPPTATRRAPRRLSRTLDPQLLDQRCLIHDDPSRRLERSAFSRFHASDPTALSKRLSV